MISAIVKKVIRERVMNIKKILIALLLVHVTFANARWVVDKIDFSSSDLSSENSTAYYGKNSSKELESLTELLKGCADKKKVSVPASHGAIGRNSQGFNKFTLHDPDGIEHAVVFDGQNAFRLQQGRVKAVALDPDLGRYTSELTGHVARAEVQQGDDVLGADSQSHQNEGDRFSIVISGQEGDYTVELQRS